MDSGCSVKKFCRNSETRCWLCRFEDPRCSDNYYKPNEEKGAPKIHPIIETEKQSKKKEQKEEKLKKALDNKKNKSKQTLAAMMESKAQKMAEKVITQKIKREFAKPTVNSGRLNRDVDHTMHKGEIRLDSKHQSKRINHQVNLQELEEARYKANKFNSELGGLILWNKEGRSVVVFDYEEWLEWEAQRETSIKEATKE